MSPPLASSGFTSQAYIAPSATSAITLASIRYGPILPDEIVLDTAAFSVCATDVKVASGAFAHCKPPLILGHECAGTVVAVGANVAGLHVGDKVVLSYASCGGCEMCTAGENAYCYELGRLNFEGRVVGAVVDEDCGGGGGGAGGGGGGDKGIKGLFFGQSSMGRRIVARASSAVKLSSETSDREMCLYASLGCGIQTGAGAIFNVAKPRPGSALCIFGAGSVGLAACLAAKLSMPAKLVLVDKSPEKLAVLPACVKAAATDLVDSSDFAAGRESEEHFVERLKGLTTGGRGFDYALDCVGRGDLVKVGHLALKAKGTIITVGGSPDVALQVTSSQHLVRGITYRGTHQGDSVPRVSIPLMIDLWKQGKFPFDELLTFYSFDELHKALRDLRAGCVIKPVLLSNKRPTRAVRDAAAPSEHRFVEIYRVIIGMELAAATMAIFLDEPTSGPDATAPGSIMRGFKAIARLGISRMGSSCTKDQSRKCEPSSRSSALASPGLPNVGDVVTDIITGNGRSYRAKWDVSKDALVAHWSALRLATWRILSGAATALPSPEARPGTPSGTDDRNRDSSSSNNNPTAARGSNNLEVNKPRHLRRNNDQLKKRGALRRKQAWLCLKRAMLQQYRDLPLLAFQLVLAALAVIVLELAKKAKGRGLVSSPPTPSSVRVFSEETLRGRGRPLAPSLAYFVVRSVSVLPPGVGAAAGDHDLLIVGILSGAAPPLRTANSWNLEWLWRASPDVWPTEIYWGQLVKPSQHIYDVHALSELIGFALDRLGEEPAFIGLFAGKKMRI
ncbi:hypothetical protein MFIFM68171_08335 [Madurella fahalii]|uniref:Enoyl reductase (ER) domain-containing protein n=1 Tax=Madurella fahalii TaxID=1157608 RepID=A0ABQ0GK24_9PEZI